VAHGLIRRALLTLIAAAGSAAGAVPGLAADADSLRVGRITVVCHDVFTESEAAEGWVYGAAAALHFRTRERTVRRFLLFREGEPYDPERLAQTERTLRDQAFIRTARVEAAPANGGAVDVLVETQDTWTTEPRAFVSVQGGVTEFGASFIERNLIGSGRRLRLTYEANVERIRRELEFSDPHLLGSYWNASVSLSNNSDGDAGAAALSHPFTGTAGRWSAGGNVAASSRRERIYRDAEVDALYGQDHASWRVEYGRALRAESACALRLSGGVSYLRDRFMPETGTPPDDREYTWIYLRAEFLESRYVTVNYVNRDSRYEDFEQGPRLSAVLGISPRGLGPEETTGWAEAAASGGVRIGEEAMLLGRVSASSRLGTPAANTLVVGELRAFRRFPGRFPQVLVGRFQGLHGWDLDRDAQYFADADAGLRGYVLYAYEGSRRVLMNLEHRVSSGMELFRIFDPGAAVFVDAGGAVPADRDPTWNDIKTDLGVGLRLGLPRVSAQDVLRLDVAWPLADDRNGERAPLVSFSASQAF
jgi:hypothetical protein